MGCEYWHSMPRGEGEATELGQEERCRYSGIILRITSLTLICIRPGISSTVFTVLCSYFFNLCGVWAMWIVALVLWGQVVILTILEIASWRWSLDCKIGVARKKNILFWRQEGVLHNVFVLERYLDLTLGQRYPFSGRDHFRKPLLVL